MCLAGVRVDADTQADQKEALKVLRVPEDQREDASAWIADVARCFRDDLAAKQWPAPRLAKLKKQVSKIDKHARELARLLDESEPYFAMATAGYLGVEDWRHDEAPNFSEILDPSQRAELALRLQRLAFIAKRLHDNLPADTRGKHKLPSLFDGTPEWILAVECWELFDWFRPGEATGNLEVQPQSDRGEYHLFVEMVYELATRTVPNTGLGAITKKVAPLCNAYAKQKPAYRRLAHCGAVGESPVGMISRTGLASSLFGAPARLANELTGRKRQD